MARLPFSPYVSSSLDTHDDPTPLLAEVAQCAHDGVPLPPRLAEWLYEAWQDGRLKVTHPRGAKSKDSLEKRSEILMAIDAWGNKPGVEKEIRRLRKSLGVKATVKVIHGWRKELEDGEDEERKIDMDQQEHLALRLFQRAAKEGVVCDDALRLVEGQLNQSCLPTTDVLRHWQWMAEYSPPLDP